MSISNIITTCIAVEKYYHFKILEVLYKFKIIYYKAIKNKVKQKSKKKPQNYLNIT